MFLLSMRKKILLYSILITTLAILVFSIAVTAILQHSIEKQTLKYLKGFTYAVDFSKTLNDEYALEIALGIDNDIRVSFIDKEGQVLGDSLGHEGLENHLDREEVKEALTNGQGAAKRYSESISRTLLYYAVIKNDIIIRFSIPISSIIEIYIQILPLIIVVIIADIVLCLAISQFMTSRLMQPLKQFSESFKINTKRSDISIYSPYPEFEPIARKGEEMIGKIYDYIDEIKDISKKEKLILDNINEGLLIVDSKKKISLINKSAINFLQYDKSRDKTIHYIIEDKDVLDSIINNCSCIIERKIKNKDIRYRINYIKEYDACVVLIVDITVEKDAQRAKTDFFNNVTHEMNTPLTSISGFAELMHKTHPNKADVKKYSGIIHNESERLIGLVKRILYYSELSNLKYDEKVNIASIIERVKNLMLPIAKKKGVDIFIDIQNMNVLSNQEAIFEIISNLVSNAVKYNKENGKVVIRAYEKDGLVFEVEDNGLGISLEHQNRIFERFYTVNISHNKNEGAGLGLAIVKKLVLNLGGEISLKSELNKGSIFKVRFSKTQFIK